jgi:c-di-GMP-related signal transduction protein
MSIDQEIFLGRQPILDRNNQLCAYELLFRNGQKNAASVTDDLGATANVVINAFIEFGVEQALGPYKGFINCDERLLMSDAIEALPPEKLVLEVLETVEITPPLVERCRELKARGFTLALDDFVDVTDAYRPMLALADIVKVEILPFDAPRLADTTRRLRQWPVQLLAEKVDARDQADHCMQLGYQLFQGYYFAKPTVISGRKVGHSQLTLMRLLNLIVQDAETTALETVLKQEPGLTLNLLRLTNSVATGVRTKITSPRHAVTMLGRRQLQRWLQLLLYTNPAGGGTGSPLLQMAATRGRLMELIATRLHGANSDVAENAFMTGILSLMPAVMNMSMEEILHSINLGAEVNDALLMGIGELGALISLAEALESGDGQCCHDITAQLPKLDSTTVNNCLTEALAWAAKIGQEQTAL